MTEELGLLLLGTFYGSTLCSITCLPVLGVYVMGTSAGFGDGLKASLFFLAGRVCSYSLLGALAGILGKVADLSAVQGKFFGATLIAAGLLLPFLSKNKCRGGCRQLGRNLGLFAMGSGTGLKPCPPLLAVFMLAAQKGSWLAGAGYGALFGTGMLASPLLLAGGGLGHLAGRIRLETKNFAPYLDGMTMGIMILSGIRAFV